MKFRKSKVEQPEYHKETLKKWSPNFMIKTGVILNIIFCSILSLLIVTIPITITAIILNALLLVPRVDTKRYHAFWKYIPVALNLFLTVIVMFIVIFTVASLEGVLNSFLQFINTYILVWTKNEVEFVNITWWLEIFEIIMLIIGSVGSILIIFGWYRGKEIGEIEVKNKPNNIK